MSDGDPGGEEGGGEAPGARRGVPPAPGAGLCNACVHQRRIPNRRGSVFSLCERSRTDPAFPRYPRLPVLQCPGFEPPRGSPGRDLDSP